MKRKLSTLLIGIALLAAGSLGFPDTVAYALETQDGYEEEKSLGIAYLLTEEMQEAGLQTRVSGISPMQDTGELDIFSGTTLFAGILVLPERAYDNYADGKNALEFYQENYPSYEISAEEHEGYHYLYVDCTKTLDLSQLSGEEQDRAQIVLMLYRDLLDSVTYIPLEGDQFVFDRLTFTTQNLDGEEMTEALFSDKDITVVNVWATYCNPCIEEMPRLAEWEQEMPENAQILYLCSDIISEDSQNIALARKIVEKSGISGNRVLFWLPGSFEALQPYVTAVPTTFFVDREGNVLEDIIVGAQVEKYKADLETLLEEQKETAGN